MEFATDAIPIVDAEPTENDLIWAFVRKQIELWGEDSVQKMFDQGFEPKYISSSKKVIWVK